MIVLNILTPHEIYCPTVNFLRKSLSDNISIQQLDKNIQLLSLLVLSNYKSEQEFETYRKAKLKYKIIRFRLSYKQM